MTTSAEHGLRKIGFCKLFGPGIEHYAQKYEITIGRKSKSTALDVVIGDNMNISRQHASIIFNFSKRTWELIVQGKNGVTIKNTVYTPSSPPMTLQSGDLLQLGDRAFFFLLEKGSRARHKYGKKQRVTGVSKSKQSQAHKVLDGVALRSIVADAAIAGSKQQLLQQTGALNQHVGGVSIPLAQPSSSPQLPPDFGVNSLGLQQKNCQMSREERKYEAPLESQVTARQAATSPAGHLSELQQSTKPPVMSPLLQQLQMAANSSAAVRPMQPTASQQPALIPQAVSQGYPVPLVVSNTPAWRPTIPRPDQASQIHYTYPSGYPAQLLQQGLQQHQHLQQQAAAQSYAAPMPRPGWRGPDDADQSSAAGQK